MLLDNRDIQNFHQNFQNRFLDNPEILSPNQNSVAYYAALSKTIFYESLYVDQTLGDDENTGKHPLNPVATIGRALEIAEDEAIPFVKIVIKEGIYLESNSWFPANVVNAAFVGVGRVELRANVAASVILWVGPITTLHNLIFRNAGNSNGVRMVQANLSEGGGVYHCIFEGNDNETDALGFAASNVYHAEIAHNRFYGTGATTSRALEQMLGTNLRIHDNLFRNWAGVYEDFGTSAKEIYRNRFIGNTESIISNGGCFVSENWFGGTYSIAGGYTAHASDEWIGNFITAGITNAKPV